MRIGNGYLGQECSDPVYCRQVAQSRLCTVESPLPLSDVYHDAAAPSYLHRLSCPEFSFRSIQFPKVTLIVEFVILTVTAIMSVSLSRLFVLTVVMSSNVRIRLYSCFIVLRSQLLMLMISLLSIYFVFFGLLECLLLLLTSMLLVLLTSLFFFLRSSVYMLFTTSETTLHTSSQRYLQCIYRYLQYPCGSNECKL